MNQQGISLRIVCPFCPLHCDGVSLDSPPECWILTEFLASLKNDLSESRVGDRAVTIDQAETSAKKLLDESDNVTLLVRSATLGQAKAIVNSGFTIRSEGSPTTHAVQTVVARCGVIAATLADVKQHADTLVVLGDVEHTVPLLSKKFASSSKVRAIPLPCADSVAELAFEIREGRQFADSAYVAFVLDSNAIDKDQAEPIVELLIETILWMNSAKRETNQRAVLFTLDPLASLRCVSAWSDSNPLQAVANFEIAGATIRIGQPAVDQPAVDIQIGGNDPGPKQATMYLPASTPGIDHVDAVIRGDSTITLPLGKVQASTTPSVADWIAKLS